MTLIKTKTLEEQALLAETIAKEAHAGQRDKSGNDYLLHISRVAAAFPNDPKLRAIAWLHDTVEDTYVNLEDLTYLGFDQEIVEAVEALTHDRYTKYDIYISQIGRSGIAAIKVKIADLEDNLGRIQDAPRELRLRKERAYRVAHKYLSEVALPRAESFSKK